MSTKRRKTRTDVQSHRNLVDEIARSIIKEHSFTPGQAIGHQGWDGEVQQACLERTELVQADNLGKIIVAFRGAELFSVHGRIWLSEYDSGLTVIQKTAATVLTWRIHQLLEAETGTRLLVHAS